MAFQWTRKRGPRGCLAAVCLAALGRPAAAESGLDLEQAIELALSRNERAAVAGEQSDAARARVDRARSFFLPDLLATGSYTRRAYETTRTVDGERLTIQSRDALLGTASLALALFDARSIPLYQQAAREADAARFQATEDRRLLAFETANAFLVTIGVQQVQAAAERRLEYARGALQDAQARFDAGLVGSNDVTRAELEAATAERALADARATVQAAYLELGNLLDSPVAPPLVVPEALLDSAAATPPEAAALVAASLQRRPDVAASRQHAAAVHAFAREPMLRAVPSLTFGAQARITNENGLSGRNQDWSMGVIAAWSLYDGGERYAERRERKALSGIADLDTRALTRGVDLEVQRSRVTLEQAQAALRAATAAVAAAQKNAAEISELYRQGLARALEVADASVRLFEAEVAQAGERFGLGRAFLGLRAAQGFDPLGREP